ncbi:MAG TPA: YbaY family lipoprotein, partial [Gemmataceae bacterium]|nr:YbaY family lipoprotein [Gemmataceae bacterium]
VLSCADRRLGNGSAAIVSGTGGGNMWRLLVCSAVAAGAVALLLSEGEAAFAQKDDKSKKDKVSGTIEFKGEAQFEANTVARVTLQDVSLADAPANKVGEQVIKDLKKFPIPFEVEYDPAAIEKGHTYAVQVRIETKDRLDYINDTRVEVISSGKPSKDVKVPVIRVKK